MTPVMLDKKLRVPQVLLGAAIATGLAACGPSPAASLDADNPVVPNPPAPFGMEEFFAVSHTRPDPCARDWPLAVLRRAAVCRSDDFMRDVPPPGVRVLGTDPGCGRRRRSTRTAQVAQHRESRGAHGIAGEHKRSAASVVPPIEGELRLIRNCCVIPAITGRKRATPRHFSVLDRLEPVLAFGARFSANSAY
jgi:hypothetical protein